MIIDGNAIASQIQQEIKQQIDRINGRKPSLAMVLVGEHPASLIYVNRKAQACEAIGIRSIRKHLSAEVTQANLIKTLDALNSDPSIDGILLQLPLPQQMDPFAAMLHISPEKDVDGLHPYNAGRLLMGDIKGFVPCTPLGIKVLLERSGITVEGKHVLIIGRSNLVGKPLAALLMQNTPGANATVTIAHSRTNNLESICQSADIVIAAMGKAKFVKESMVKKGSVIIDVGINKIDDPAAPKGYQIVGDVDFENVKNKCAFISPVPGGVGPMTIAMLLSNTWKSFQNRVQSL